jgi:hypothetical protein
MQKRQVLTSYHLYNKSVSSLLSYDEIYNLKQFIIYQYILYCVILLSLCIVFILAFIFYCSRLDEIFHIFDNN